MNASLSRSTRLRRGFVLAAISVLLGAVTTLACSSDDEASADDAVPASSVYVPAEAAAQNPIPPGVTPRAPTPEQPRPTPTDSGSSGSTDSGSTPKSDASADGAM